MRKIKSIAELWECLILAAKSLQYGNNGFIKGNLGK